MREIVFKLVVDTDSTHGKLERVGESLDELKAKGEKGSYYTFTTDADGKLRAVLHDLEEVKAEAEEPKVVKVTADQALATIRDVKIAFDGVLQVLRVVTTQINSFLDANLKQKQAMQLANHVFKESAQEMADFATQMQEVTNFGDDDLLPLMAKLQATFKLTGQEITQLVPLLLDFTEANKATGMTVESAFDLMGRALNGHTEMLGRYGIELDDTRLKQEGVSYLVEKLGEDYGGTAIALADLRTQNANLWGDIRETVGGMIETIISPLLQGLRWLMDVYNDLSPVMKGFVTGVGLAIPVVVSLATGITALVAAVNALKVAINPVVGILSLVAGAVTVAGMAIAASVPSAEKMQDGLLAIRQEASLSIVQFENMVSTYESLAQKTNRTSEEQALLSRTIADLKQQYPDYLRNLDMERGYHDEVRKAINQTREAMYAKMQAQVQEKALNQFSDQMAKLYGLISELRANDPEGSGYVKGMFQDAEGYASGLAFKLLTTNEAIQELERRIAAFKKKAMDAAASIKVPAATASGGGGGDTGTKPGSDGEERRLEQLRLLQQRYDVLAIDDATARRQAELEVQRNAEVAKAESLGASEELIQGIRDHFAKESIRVEQDAADARLRAMKAEEEAKQKAVEEEARRQQELQDIRYEFEQRGLDLAGATYDAQLRAIDRYYAQRREKLLAAGYTETQIAQQNETAKQRIRDSYNERAISGLSKTFGDLAKATEVFGKKGFALWKTLAIGQAMIDTYASATAAYKAMAGIPVVGPGLAIAAAAAAVAAGLANVAVISKQEPPRAATGGLLVGNSHSQGGVLIEAEGDEYITAKDRVRALGKGLFDFLNFAPLDQVKKAFLGFTAPDIPIPESVAYAYAGGGSVGGNGLMSIMEAINDKMGILVEKNVQFDIHVDPLANDPVKVSEIADTGKILRSEL